MYTSPLQAIDVAIELKEAADGTNGFGGDTAEIYAYTLLPHKPTGKYDTQDYIKAATSLGNIIHEICIREDKNAFINEMAYQKWISKHASEFNHRVHVRFE